MKPQLNHDPHGEFYVNNVTDRRGLIAGGIANALYYSLGLFLAETF
jgi:hypothetical protein